MDIELREDGREARFVVRCDDAPLRTALADLYFEPVGDAYEKAFPVGSVDADVFERFRSALPPMLRQAARLEQAPWRAALREAARILATHRVDWWLAGSAALAVRGVPVEPRDIDLVVAEDDARRVAAAFAEALVEPPGEPTGWIARFFGRAWLGARVEWVAGVAPWVDEPEPADFGAAAAARLETIRWEGRELRVPPLELQRAVSIRRGLHERVTAIDALRRPSTRP